MVNNIKYEKRIVFFIDILGFKALVEGQQRKKPEDIARILKAIKNLSIKDWGSRIKIPSKIVTCVSDTVVISFDYKNPSSLFYAIKAVQEMQNYLIGVEGVLIRGACALGDLYHSDEMIFGLAMNKACELEKDYAENPRIIIPNYIIDIASNYSENDGYLGLSEKEHIQKLLKQDVDGYFYIDYISNLASTNAHNIKNHPSEDFCDGNLLYEFCEENQEWQSYLIELRKVIAKGLQIENHKIHQKYLWLKEKYNECIKHLEAYLEVEKVV